MASRIAVVFIDSTKELSELLDGNNLKILSGVLDLNTIDEPANPPAGRVFVYSRLIAGRGILEWKGDDGYESPVQSGLFFSRVSLIQGGGGTTVNMLGCLVANVGTIAHPVPAVTNLKTIQNRFTNTSAATAGSLASTRVQSLECVRGNADGIGGFFMVCRFGLAALQTGMRGFFGLVSTVSAPTNINPLTSTTLAKIGIGLNASTGNLSLVYNAAGVAPTVIDLGASFPVSTTNMYELVLFCSPNDSKVSIRIKNMNTNEVHATTEITTNLPTSTTFLARVAWLTNNATAAAVAFDIAKFGLETDN